MAERFSVRSRNGGCDTKQYCNNTRGSSDAICRKGQLTWKGVVQMKSLGENLHQIYKAFLASKADLVVRSTGIDRTIESAMYLAAALLPNEFGVEITTHPKNSDTLIYFYDFQCLNQMKLTSQLGASQDLHDIQDWFTNLHPEIHVPTFVGPEYTLQITTGLQRCRFCHNLNPGNRTSVDNIVTALNAQTRLVFFDLPGNSPQLHRLRVGSLLLEMKQAILTYPKKFFLYSTHDLTISALLSGLGIRQTKFTPYAANLLIELWAPKPLSSSQSDVHQYQLRFIYNGSPVTASWCTYNSCSVSAFINHLEKNLLLFDENHANAFNYSDECKLSR